MRIQIFGNIFSPGTSSDRSEGMKSDENVFPETCILCLRVIPA